MGKTMRTILITMALMVLPALTLGGCSGVIMTPTYSRLLDETAALSGAFANSADANTCPPGDMRRALRWNADAWKRFVAARDGQAPESSP